MMYLGSRRDERSGCLLRTSKAEHLMTSANQFLDDCGTDEACRPGDKNTHILFLLRSCEFGRYGRSVHSTCESSRILGSDQSPFAGGSRQAIDLDQLAQPAFCREHGLFCPEQLDDGGEECCQFLLYHCHEVGAT